MRRVALIALVSAAVVSAQGRASGLVVYYAEMRGAEVGSTICADTYGRISIFRGRLKGKPVASPETYSLCVESPEDEASVDKIMTKSGIDHGFAATLSR